MLIRFARLVAGLYSLHPTCNELERWCRARGVRGHMSVTQAWDPRGYAQHARFVADLGLPVLELLAPRSGERVLDLGCGDGALTQKLVAAGCQVVALDSSAEQVATTRLGSNGRAFASTVSR